MNDNSAVPELPLQLYRAEQVRELDRIAIQDKGIPGLTLMRRAARAAFDRLLILWPEPDKIIIFCGVGNSLLTNADPELDDPEGTKMFFKSFPSGTSKQSLVHFGQIYITG